MESLTVCPSCRRQIPRDARFCPLCGVRMGVVAGPNSPMVGAGTGLLPPQHCLHGHYIIQRKLAQGGQSAVYLAIDMRLGDVKLAIKEMSQAHLLPHERDRAVTHFQREAHLLQHLDHPMLAKVYDYFIDGDKHYLAMEYVPGKTLEDEMMELGRPLEWESVIGWSAQLCDVLGYLHRQTPPIVYRDLKPANVMLTPTGRLKLIDFGIARRLVPARMNDTAQLGTDGYAPLEQYASKSEPRSDLYALGASMYHLLTGRVPDNAPLRSSGAKLRPIRAVSPNVPEAVEQVVMQALNLTPDERYPDAQTLGRVLSSLLPTETAPRERVSAATKTGKASKTGKTSASAASTPTSAGSTRMRPRAVVLPPKLYVWPLRLDAGEISTDANDDPEFEVEVANRGGGELSGQIEASTHTIRVDPSQLDGATTLVRVRVATAGLATGPHTYHIAVRTNGGDQIIPVRFAVHAPAGASRSHRP